MIGRVRGRKVGGFNGVHVGGTLRDAGGWGKGIKERENAKGQGAEGARINSEWLKKRIEDGNRFIEKMAKIKYEYDYYNKPPKRIIVRVVDRETGKVIREIPPEKFLKFVTKLIELAGIMFDEEA